MARMNILLPLNTMPLYWIAIALDQSPIVHACRAGSLNDDDVEFEKTGATSTLARCRYPLITCYA